MAEKPIHEYYFEELSPELLTYLHLTAAEPRVTLDYAVISTLAVTEREVRSAINNYYSKNILPIMGMVAIIEQLGEAYKRTDINEYQDNNHSSFKKGLYYFYGQDFNNDLTKTLYGLRNGVVHNASFFSVGKGAQPNYIFRYSFDKPEVVTPSAASWNGSFDDIHTDYFTDVNPEALLNLVRDCIAKVKEASDNGNLEIVLAGGKNELIFRYFKWRELE